MRQIIGLLASFYYGLLQSKPRTFSAVNQLSARRSELTPSIPNTRGREALQDAA